MQALEIQDIQMQALLIAMHLFFDLWNSACFMFQKLLSLFCFHSSGCTRMLSAVQLHVKIKSSWLPDLCVLVVARRLRSNEAMSECKSVA